MTVCKISQKKNKFFAIGFVVFLLTILAVGIIFVSNAFLVKAENEINANRAARVDVGSMQNQAGGEVEYAVDLTTGMVNYLEKTGNEFFAAGRSDSPTASATRFLNEYAKYFGIGNPARDLKISEEKQDELGMTHLTFNHYHQGVPVYGSQLIIHVNPDNSIRSANGRIVPGVSTEVVPKVSQEEAGEIAKQIFGQEGAEVASSELYIFNKTLIENSYDENDYLVWKIEMIKKGEDGGVAAREEYFINALSKEKTYELPGIKTAINREIYDCSLYPFFGDCGLDDLWGGYTYGRSEGQPARGNNPWYGSDDTDDLYSNAGSAHNYYYNTYGLNGANNQGGIGNPAYGIPAALTVGAVFIDDVYGSSWCPNAMWTGTDIEFCYGMATTDIIGHEYGHAVLDFAVPDIPYSYEGGAVHESYADLAGEAVERYRYGSSDWVNGADVTLVSIDPRSLKDPNSSSDGFGPLPSRFYDSFFYCGTNDNGGVHHNSTVPSHAGYLMAEGGVHNGCTISGIGQTKQEKIFYRAEQNYITSNVDFNSLYTALNSSCSSLYGAGSSECANVKKALQSVELDQGGRCSSEARQVPECAAATTPYFSNKGPASGSSGVAVDSDIYFEVDDTGSGINKNTLRVKINGTLAINAGAFQSGYNGTITSDGTGYHVTINPTNNFSNKETVSIYAGASNNANTLGSTSWSFTTIPAIDPKIVATSGPGEATRMQAYDNRGNALNSEVHNLFPSGYLGGAGVVAIDANNDGLKDEIVVFAREGGGPQARVFSMRSDSTLMLLGQMFVFDETNRSGLSVTVGDFDADGFKDDIAACLTGNDQPEVRVYKDARGVDNWERIGQIVMPFGNVGCNLGTFQYDDGAEEILAGPNHGPADPNVYIYTVGGTQKKQFAAYGQGVQSGVTPSGIGDRIYTTPNNGSSQVNAFDRNGNWKNYWWAYAEHVRGDWLNVAGDVDGDGVDEILTAPFGANGPQILAFEPSGKWRTWPNFFAFSEHLRNGVGIAVIDNWSD